MRRTLKGQGGFTLVETAIVLAIMGIVGAQLVGIFWQFNVLSGRVGADQVTLSDLRNGTNWLFEDGRKSQVLAIRPQPDYFALDWTDFTNPPPSFSSVRYRYAKASTETFRDLGFDLNPPSPQSLMRDIAAYDDVSFRRTPDYFEAAIKSTSEISIEPRSTQTKLLVQPRATAAQPPPAGGYAIFVTGPGAPGMKWSGSESRVIGNIHANGQIVVSGSDHLVGGVVEAVSGITVPGSNHFFDSRNSSAPSLPLPVTFTTTQFEPVTFDFAGDVNLINVPQVWLDPGRSVLKPGVYRATGRIKLSNSNVSGNVTFVADGIEISGSGVTLVPFHGTKVLFYATGTIGDTIKISGSNVTWAGIWYAPNGTVQLSGSDLLGEGSIYARELQWSGSGGRISFDPRLF